MERPVANPPAVSDPRPTTRQHPRRGVVLHDIHAQVHRTRVAEVIEARDADDVVATIRRAARERRPVSVSGGRHAMGGQAFAEEALHLDMRGCRRLLALDRNLGRVTVEVGIEWPQLMQAYGEAQHDDERPWGIVQKQTGADRLSIGGAIAANIHGRCLTRGPFIQDLVELSLIDAEGRLIRCSRRENVDLFRLVVGGYGLFGIVVSATLQLAPRQKVRRIVTTLRVDDLMAAFKSRIREGFLYGDFQFAIDPRSSDFLRQGVLSCYLPVSDTVPMTDQPRHLTPADWSQLLLLAHTDKTRAFEEYRDFYLSTSGQVYWSDSHQTGFYLDNYHQEVDRRMGARHRSSEMIGELYVPRDRLVEFLERVRGDFRRHDADLIYGTIRLIERDDESFLNWAREAYACVVFNLHTEHTPEGLERTRCQFRRLIDIAIALNGSYYLTYHRFAEQRQLLACYPQFPEFLRLKRQLDPSLRFQSDWYRHYAGMFGA